MATWTTSYNTWLTLVVTATESNVDISSNSSRVNVTVQLKSNSTTRVFALDNQSISVSIDGTSVHSGTFKYDIYNRGTVTLYSGSRTVAHNDDGSKSASVVVSTSGNAGGGSINNSLTLTKIARASIPTLSHSTRNIGDVLTIYFNRKHYTFRHELSYSIGGESGVVVSKSVDLASYPWTLPDNLANGIKNSTTGTMTLTLKTYDGGTQIGSSQTITVTVGVPNTSTFNPTIGTPSITELASEVSSGVNGVIVDGKSKIRFSSTASAKMGATVKSISIKFVKGSTWTYNATMSGNTGTYDWSANNVGSWSITMTVTDSRGRRTESGVKTLSVTAYNAPKLSMNAYRGANETSIVLEGSATGSSLSSLNTMTMEVYIKPQGEPSWGTRKNLATSTNGTVKPTTLVYSGYTSTVAYDVRIRVRDELTDWTESTFSIPTSKVLMDLYRDTGVGIGKYYETAKGGSLQVGGLATFDGNIMLSGTDQDIRFSIDPTVGNASIELGSTTAVSTPYIDFHSTGTTNDRDARIVVRGGFENTNESAQMELLARNVLVNGVDTKGLGITTQSSNSNGTYVQFETGIMICWHEMRTSSGANNTTGSIFRTNTTQWNFPASFVGTPIMIANPIGVAAECWAGMGASGVGTTSSSFMVWSTWNRGTSTINVGLVAIGRWR